MNLLLEWARKYCIEKKEETLYSIRALPIGGFVRMEGEDESSETEDSFWQKDCW